MGAYRVNPINEAGPSSLVAETSQVYATYHVD